MSPQEAATNAKRRAGRLAAGLCQFCGKAPRGIGEGATPLSCPACAEYFRAAARASHARRKERVNAERRALAGQRRAAGRCTVCGTPLRWQDRCTVESDSFGSVDPAAITLCLPCRLKKRRHQHAHQRRRRPHRPIASFYGGDPLHVGHGAERVCIVKQIGFSVDMGALMAIRELKARDIEQRRKAARPGERAPDTLFRLSRILREAILFWEDQPTRPPVRTASYRKYIECQAHFGVDARTLAVLERFRPHRGGNMAATVCDLLCATAAVYRRKWVVVAGRRQDETRDPWTD